MYAAASNIHIDSQMWLVGIYDIGPGLLALLCIGSFIKRWLLLSRLWFALALGFEEGTAMLFLRPLCMDGARWRRCWGTNGWKGAVGDAPEGAPVYRNLFARLKWRPGYCPGRGQVNGRFTLCASTDASVCGAAHRLQHRDQFPDVCTLWAPGNFAVEKRCLYRIRGTHDAVCSDRGACARVYRGGQTLRRAQTGRRRPLIVTLFVLGWFFLMLFPPLTLENHFSRYYLTAALPPLVIGTMSFQDRDAKYNTQRADSSIATMVYGCKCD